MRAAIYTRISTDKQTHDSQLGELRAYCQRRGWPDVAEYSDQISGAKFTRKGLDRLLQDVRRGRLDAVVVFKLDRLGRSLAHLAQLISEFTAHRVALICTSQGIDSSDGNPAGRLQLGVLMAVAEFERAIIQERVAAGLRAAKARGVKLGRPNRGSIHLASVTRLAREGKGIRETARELKLPVSTVAKLRKAFTIADTLGS